MTQALLAGALDHLMRYQLTGCGHSAHVAAHLLEQLADQADVDSHTRCLCGRMSEALVAGQETAAACRQVERHV